MNSPDVISSIVFVLTATISGGGSQTLGEYLEAKECEAQRQIMIGRYRDTKTPALVSCTPRVECTRKCFDIRPK